MESFELNAETRQDVGKGASRRLRRDGKLPGVIYGSNKDAESITLRHDDVIHQLENEAFYSHILTLNVDKKPEKVVLKDLQRHPYKPSVMHIDFQRISDTEKLTMRVPLHFVNEEKCVGVKTGGGVISHIMTELEISCFPKNLPEYIEVDMLEIDVGEAIHLGDIQLPEGVEIYALLHGGDAAQSVASVQIPRVVEEEDEAVESEEGDAAEAATPEADEGDSE
jgi:large subunit ribosomal protein L25